MSDMAACKRLLLKPVSKICLALLLGGLQVRRVVIEGNIRTRFRRSAILLSGSLSLSAHANDRLRGKLLMGVARLGSASNDRLSISVTLLHNLHTAFLYTPHDPRLPQLISLPDPFKSGHPPSPSLCSSKDAAIIPDDQGPHSAVRE